MQNIETNYTTDFVKLKKCLQSCLTPEHLKTTGNMYRNFEKKFKTQAESKVIHSLDSLETRLDKIPV